MEIGLSKFSSYLLLLLFIFSVLVSQKSIAIHLEDRVYPMGIITYERTIRDVLISKGIYLPNTNHNTSANKIRLHENMVIKIGKDQSINSLE